MQAFLLIGNNESFENEIEKLASNLNAKVMPYKVSKIEDIRQLNKFLRLTINEKTLIVIHNIHEASTESLNAFLKNLEEPQENIYFALTAPRAKSVLPTIVSRCQIIRVQSTKYRVQNEEEIKKFLILNLGQRIAFFDIIKDRTEAISFIEDLIYYLHDQKNFDNMEILIETLSRLKRNANVNLQLTNLAINYTNEK